jgi:hypothetical protein
MCPFNDLGDLYPLTLALSLKERELPRMAAFMSMSTATALDQIENRY